MSRIFAIYALLAVSGCGGGSGGPQPNEANAPGRTLSGTVAVGAPMMNATLTVMGANGKTVGASVGDSGSYSALDVTELTEPYRLQACGLTDGRYQCYYSVVQSAGVANVTPLTDAAVALATGADASSVFTGAMPSASALGGSEAKLQAYLGSVLSAAGLSPAAGFGTTPFNADRTGMDKVLDAVKVRSGRNNGASYVQLEGIMGFGNAYIDSEGNQTGSLNNDSILRGMQVDLTGISSVFQGLSAAASGNSIAACEATMTAQVVFDSSFSLDMNGQSVTRSNAAPSLCSFVATNGFLGGKVENPTLRRCDFSGPDKLCRVGFNLVKDSRTFEGATMAVVLRNGAKKWALLGDDNPYGVTVGVAVQRALLIGAANSQPRYTRAIAIDIPTSVSSGAPAPHSAKVYAHDGSGTGAWDLAAPIAVLSDAGCAGQRNLTIMGSSCGATWLSLDNFNSLDLRSGDELIDALFRRGRQLRVDLYSDAAGAELITSVYVQINGVPPKSADLPSVPWLNLDAASQTALANLGSAAFKPATFDLAWDRNTSVVPHDITLCTDSGCHMAARAELPGTRIESSATLDVSGMSISADGYKRLVLYGRDKNDAGFESVYLSCAKDAPQCN